jgi:hypothetical protein
LTRIGYWLGPDTPGWPDVTQFVDSDWDDEEREGVAIYLKWGLPAKAYCGPSRCRLCGIVNGSVELTDGTFIWPEGLFHYVAAHKVRLPQEFVDHVRANSGRYDNVDVEDDWWREQRGGAAGRRTKG